jgi:hypothetical protein
LLQVTDNKYEDIIEARGGTMSEGSKEEGKVPKDSDQVGNGAKIRSILHSPKVVSFF